MFKRVVTWRWVKVRPHKRPAEYAAHKEAARALAHERIAHFNQIYQFSIGRVFIKNHASRWGSCSQKGNLNFCYKIALLPPHLADYVIVHELCHLGEFNHSPAFWNLVAQTIPDHRARRAALRHHSAMHALPRAKTSYSSLAHLVSLSR